MDDDLDPIFDEEDDHLDDDLGPIFDEEDDHLDGDLGPSLMRKTITWTVILVQSLMRRKNQRL